MLVNPFVLARLVLLGFVQSFESLEKFRTFEGPFPGMEKWAKTVSVWKRYKLSNALDRVVLLFCFFVVCFLSFHV